MRLGEASMIRRTTFCRQPGAGRVDDERRRGARPARPARAARARTSPAKKLRVVDAVGAGVVDGVGDGLLDELDAPQLAGARGERQRDRADAAVEVVEALPALERRELAGDAVEPLGHLGVRLEERLGRRSRKRSPPSSSWMRSSPDSSSCRPPLGRLAEAVGAGPQQRCRTGTASTRLCDVDRRPGRSDQAHLHLARCGGPRGRRGCAAGRRACGGRSAAGAARAPRRARRRAPRCRARRRAGSRRSPTISSHEPGRVEAADQRAVGVGVRRSTRACCGSATARPRGRSSSSSKPSRRPMRLARRRPARA